MVQRKKAIFSRHGIGERHALCRPAGFAPMVAQFQTLPNGGEQGCGEVLILVFGFYKGGAGTKGLGEPVSHEVKIGPLLDEVNIAQPICLVRIPFGKRGCVHRIGYMEFA